MTRLSRGMAGVLLVGLALTVGAAWAESPALAGPMPRRIYMNKSAFVLPAILDNLDVTKLRELRLYVKAGNSDWVLKSTTVPSQPSFNCNVSQDGEYWFDIVAVDRSGEPPAPDFTQTSSMLIIVVDTQQPEVEVRALPQSAEGTLVECSVRDANPDPAGVRLEYESPLKGWQPLEAVAGRPGFYRMPGHLTLPLPVRATAIDRAGNSTVRLVNLAAGETVASQVPVETRSGKLPVPAAAEPAPVLALDRAPIARGEPRMDEPSEPILMPGTRVPDAPSLSHQGPARTLINHKHIALKYQIEQLGPSGLGKVQVYGTRDRGQTWQYLTDDPDLQSPAEVDLPGEGLIGLKLVVSNGLGVGARAPVGGDTPDFWVEVDTTKPVAQLQEIQPIVGSDAPTLLVVWTAEDKNLGEAPIQLLYSSSREGPWQQMAPRMKNHGKYRWPLPSGLGAQIFVRMVVTDEAGNMTQSEAAPVALDLTPPRVRVLGLESEARPN